MKRYLAPILAVVGVFSSCASYNTPEKRINARPDVYNSLKAKDQEAVKNGRVLQGMSKEAVVLAVGEADQVGQANKDGKDYEVWIYTKLRQVNSPYYYGGFGLGYGYGGFGGLYGYPYGGMYFGPSYVSIPAGRVYFYNNKVSAWSQDNASPRR